MTGIRILEVFLQSKWAMESLAICWRKIFSMYRMQRFLRHPHHHSSALCQGVGVEQRFSGGILSKYSQRPSGDSVSRKPQTATIVVKVKQFMNFCYGWDVVLSTASSPLHSKILKRAFYSWTLQRKFISTKQCAQGNDYQTTSPKLCLQVWYRMEM